MFTLKIYVEICVAYICSRFLLMVLANVALLNEKKKQKQSEQTARPGDMATLHR